MKGLLLKEFYTMKSNSLYWLILMLIVFFYPFIYDALPLTDDQNPSYASTFVIFYFITMWMVNQDKKDGWCDYCTAMPVTKEQYVTEKYIIMMIIYVIMLLLQVASICCKNIIADRSINVLDVFIGATPRMIISAVIVPSVFAENILKRSLYDYIVLASVFIVAIGIILIAIVLAELFDNVIGIIILSITVVAFYIASWRVSVALFEGRIIRE